MLVSSKPNNHNKEIIVKTMAGMEDILAEEIKSLGAEKVEILNRAVKAFASTKTIYRINFCSYFALRVLIPIRVDTIHDEVQLYNSVKRIDWTAFISPEQTIAVRSAVNSANFTNSHYVELKTKDAIVDQFNERFGSRPDVELDNPDLSVNIHIFKSSLTISLDSSGDSLHKRGYRISSTVAPINEVTAAGLIKLSGWNYTDKFIDPMCGSGTFLAEAILQKLRIPPQQIHRNFSFKQWKDFNQEAWEEVVAQSMENQLNEENFKVYGSDTNPKAIDSAQYNLSEAGLIQYVDLQVKNFHEYEVTSNAHLILNPPYDVRIQADDIIEEYKKIGDTLKQKFVSSQAWIISGNIDALKRVGLRPSKKIHMMNGPIESKFHKFEMYAGSKKAKYQK